MSIPELRERLEILRRIAEAGLKKAQSNRSQFVDNFQHMLDELERIKV